MMDSILHDSGQKANYSQIARQVGVRSRSYIRMVFKGEKTPSLQIFSKILAVLKLSAPIKRYVLLQLQWETATQIREREQIELKLKICRGKLGLNSKHRPEESLYRNLDLPKVFASLGSSDKGATLDQIQVRTRLHPDNIMSALKELIQLELVSFKEDIFYPCSSELLLPNASADGYLKEFYLQLSANSQKKARTEFGHRENLFCGFVVSVDSTKRKDYSDRLYRLLSDFLSEIEAPDGDTLIYINLGLHQ